ncbi:hypothetical protein [Thalassoglobus sp.]|uniref:hypothetical protein n=1 Tax=Thalassoglobus sp. TaxID=2795869 RepID=UPI003AA9C79F
MSIAGEGVRLSYDGTSVTGLENIEPPEQTVEDVRTNGFDSTAMTFRASQVKDSGELSYSFFYDDANATHQAILSGIGSTVEHVITYPQSDGTGSVTWTFDAYTKSASLTGIEEGSEVMGEVTAKVTGDITKGTA